MADERTTLEDIARAGNLNTVQKARLDQLRAANAFGRPDGGIENPGAATSFFDDGVSGIQPVGAGGAGGGNYPPFNFDWAAARTKALDSLTPYYTQKLADAKGDVELAKKYIEEDYQKGIRIAGEDYTRDYGPQGYQTLEGQRQLAEDTNTATGETRSSIGEANNRGVYSGEISRDQSPDNAQAPVGEYYGKFLGQPLAQSQELRRQAIQRAVQRQAEVAGVDKARTEESAGITKARGLEEQNIQYPRTQQALEEEKKQRAFNEVAPQQYQEALTQYRALNKIPS